MPFSLHFSALAPELRFAQPLQHGLCIFYWRKNLLVKCKSPIFASKWQFAYQSANSRSKLLVRDENRQFRHKTVSQLSKLPLYARNRQPAKQTVASREKCQSTKKASLRNKNREFSRESVSSLTKPSVRKTKHQSNRKIIEHDLNNNHEEWFLIQKD